MKMRVFQSNKGDCFLLSSADDKHVLVDGGMRNTFKAHVAKYLSEEIDQLDLVCVTHIDQDHIQGIIELCENTIDWKVYHYQEGMGNGQITRPSVPEPPPILSVWHNAFEAQFDDDSDLIASLAEAHASIYSSGPDIQSQAIANTLQNLAFSKKEGYLLSETIGPHILDLPLNQEFGGKLVRYRRNRNVITLGSMTLRILAPHLKDIQNLRDDWKAWLTSESGKKAIKKVNDAIEKQKSRPGVSFANELDQALSIALQELGDRTKVTTPNLASIMFVAEEDGKSILCTGDGHAEDIENGLKVDGTYDVDTGSHFDVIKVPHHGSEHNAHPNFWKKFTADHYVFCGNGAHHNPDLRIVESCIDARLADKNLDRPGSGKPFKFWFNAPGGNESEREKHMTELEMMVKRRAGQVASENRLRYRFLSGSSMVVVR